MHENIEGKGKSRLLAVRLALVGAGVAVGAITATTVGADALTVGSTATASTSASTSTASTSTAARNPQAPANAPGAKSVRADEKVVTGTTATTLKAAALKAVPGGTVYRVETDSGDATYEAHMTKSDGTDVTVKFDKNLTVTAVEPGMGK